MFLAACQEAGIPFNPELNGADIAGCGYFPATIEGNRRGSTAQAYLHPATAPQNLTAVSNALVTKLIVERGRVTGVGYVVPGTSHSARAMRETVLAAGAIGSPQLLQLSGIGPVDVLRAADVEIVHDLPGVGENLQDHRHCGSRWEVTAPLTPFGRTAAETAAIEARYAAERTGPVGSCKMAPTPWRSSIPSCACTPWRVCGSPTPR